MRRLYFASGNMLTADPVCKAVLRYSRALAEEQTSDVVTIPVILEGGGVAFAHLLVGPASQLFSTPVPDRGDEIDFADLVDDLEQRTRRLQPSRPEWPDEMKDVPWIEEGYPGE